mmetsp:Transcript_4815/g.10182  ORF Transcript_4815/g.10182 Transcript_4815/m.10182 type:complete len:357 (-) Transcript_4815:45-1115(-)
MSSPSALGKRKSASEGDATLLREPSSEDFLEVNQHMLAYSKAVAKVCERIWDPEAEVEFQDLKNFSNALSISLRKLQTVVNEEKRTTETVLAEAREKTAAAQRAKKREVAHVRLIAELREEAHRAAATLTLTQMEATRNLNGAAAAQTLQAEVTTLAAEAVEAQKEAARLRAAVRVSGDAATEREAALVHEIAQLREEAQRSAGVAAERQTRQVEVTHLRASVEVAKKRQADHAREIAALREREADAQAAAEREAGDATKHIKELRTAVTKAQGATAAALAEAAMTIAAIRKKMATAGIEARDAREVAQKAETVHAREIMEMRGRVEAAEAKAASTAELIAQIGAVKPRSFFSFFN